MKPEERECILAVGSTMFLLPQDRATEVFRLLHGATSVDQRYVSDRYIWSLSKYSGEIKLQHAPENIRALLVLEGEP